MVKVSIGIPVYNANEYLRECLDSILNQTFQDFEVLLVDDGSTDGSYNICYEYDQKSDKIRYYHQNHKGIDDTRNLILREADGDFITWIEATDSVEPNYLQYLVDIQNKSNADIVISGFKEYREREFSQSVNLEPYFEELEDNEYTNVDKYRALVLFLSHWTSFFYSWGKLVSMRTHLGVMYPKEFINKDMATTYKLYLHTDNIVVDREELYNHRIIDERVTLGDRDILADYEDKQRVLDEMMMITEIMNFNVAAVRDLCSQVMNNEYNAAMGKLSESWKPKLDKLRSKLAD